MGGPRAAQPFRAKKKTPKRRKKKPKKRGNGMKRERFVPRGGAGGEE